MRIDRLHRLYLAITLAVTLASIIITGVRGLNLGIDFTGGTLLERGFQPNVTAADVRRTLISAPLADLKLSDTVVQPLEGESQRESVLLIRTRPLAAEAVGRIDTALGDALGDVDVRRTDVVGPVIGGELVRKGIGSVVAAAVLILAYVAVRFEYRFGVGVIASLLHDAFLTLGVFSLFRIEVNATFVAALLTIAGYSINDTIVVFDRIRENLAKRRREDLGEIVTTSVNQTLVRSLYTSLTTLLAAAALFAFGGATIKTFMLALLIGIGSGTYSSIFLATPLWYAWRRFDEGRAIVVTHKA